MGRNENQWISFKGITSMSMNVRVSKLPDIVIAEERGTAVEVPGRDGDLWIEDNSYKSIKLKIEIEINSNADFDAVTAWLSGNGSLILSSLSDYRYEARITDGFDLKNGIYLRGYYRTTVTFMCQPFRYQASNPIMDPITTPGTFPGRGTLPARPVITVHGTGSVNLLINGNSVLFDDIDGTAVLDCEAMMAFDGNGLNISPAVTLLGSDDDADEWPVLRPAGEAVNLVNWSGSVTDVVIEPRWRWR